MRRHIGKMLHWNLLVFSDILVGCEMCVSELWRQISRLFPNTVIWEWSRQEDRVGEKFLICRRRGRLLSQSLARTQGFPKVLRKDGMLDILKVSPLALCIFYSRQGAEDAKVPPRTLLLCSLYTLCTLAIGLAGNWGGEDKSLRFRVFDGRRAAGREYGENEAKWNVNRC